MLVSVTTQQFSFNLCKDEIMTTSVNFDATNIVPWGAGTPILPVGDKQKVVIESGELKGSAKDANNGQIEFILRIIEGPNAGKTGGLKLGIYHQNPQSAGIANQKLSAICHVLGVQRFQDLRQLYNLPFLVDVVSQPDSKYTDITNFYDVNGFAPGRAQQAPAAAPSFAPSPAAAPQAAPAAFTPPAVAYDPNQAVPVSGFGAPAAAPGFASGGFAPGGAFPSAVPQQAAASTPTAPGFSSGQFPTPPQTPGTAPQGQAAWPR